MDKAVRSAVIRSPSTEASGFVLNRALTKAHRGQCFLSSVKLPSADTHPKNPQLHTQYLTCPRKPKAPSQTAPELNPEVWEPCVLRGEHCARGLSQVRMLAARLAWWLWFEGLPRILGGIKSKVRVQCSRTRKTICFCHQHFGVVRESECLRHELSQHRLVACITKNRAPGVGP